MDFTLKIYRQLLETLQSQGYSFCTFQEYCEGKAVGKYVILRHDIDKKPNNALRFAQLEAEMGIKSTYFFLTLKEIFKPKVIKQIEDLGHEIGYHYRDLVDAGGNPEKAIYSFKANLSKLRAIVTINTIAMDGCPWSKYDNKDLWKTYNYRDYDIIGEPYFDIDFNSMHYLTDTGRRWDGAKYSVRDKVETRHATSVQDSSQLIVNSEDHKLHTNFHSTQGIILSLQSGTFPSQVMITSHPQRWTDDRIVLVFVLFFLVVLQCTVLFLGVHIPLSIRLR